MPSFDRVLPHCSSMASCVEGDSPLALRRTTYVSVDASSPRMHCTAMIVHPEFPQGAAHWLHPCEHLRAFSDVKIPGLPFTLRVPQRQGVGGDGLFSSMSRSTAAKPPGKLAMNSSI